MRYDVTPARSARTIVLELILSTGPQEPVRRYSRDAQCPVGREGGTWPLMAHFRTYEITIKHQAYRPLEVGSCLIDQFHYVRKSAKRWAISHWPGETLERPVGNSGFEYES